MAYEMVMPYHLHMPSYFLETFTEYPYGITGVPEKGYVIVTVNNVRYIVYFYKIESGWNIEKVEECL